MLAVQKTAPAFGLDLAEAADPRPGPGEVLVEVDAVGICGSDVHVYEWTAGYDWMRDKMPLTIGHEFAGRVVEAAPDVSTLKPGQRVTVWPSIACGHCRSCAAGRPEACENRTTIGLTRHGAFARRVTAPASQCFALPDGLDMELAAMTEPLCVGARAVEVGEVALGQTVVVLGAGMIGLSIALMARMAGASIVIVAGLNDDVRLETARKLGFRQTVDLAHETLEQAVRRIAGGPVDRVFEATGASSSIAEGLRVLRRGGVLVVTGIHANPVEINLTDLVRNKHQIRGSHGSVRTTWDTVLRILAQSGDSFRPLISHRIALEKTVEGFELSRSKAAVKVMVLPGLT
jgi:2-desacetyl-2-hydroxyethyl bacteriochlorophyllide A dehydrogenase